MNKKETKAIYIEYEIVKVIAKDRSKQSIFGCFGVVLAATEKDEGGWYYTVFIREDGCCWCLEQDEIEKTFEFANPSDFMRRESIRVRVDDSGFG